MQTLSVHPFCTSTRETLVQSDKVDLSCGADCELSAVMNFNLHCKQHYSGKQIKSLLHFFEYVLLIFFSLKGLLIV